MFSIVIGQKLQFIKNDTVKKYWLQDISPGDSIFSINVTGRELIYENLRKRT